MPKHLYSTSFLIIAAVFFIGFASPINYQHKGVSFMVPDQWRITEEMPLSQEAYTLACEDSGLEGSGILILSWFYDSLAVDDLLLAYSDQLHHNEAWSLGGLTVSQVTTGTWGTFDSQQVHYSLSLLGEEYSGAIHCFHGFEKTLIIHQHGLSHHHKMNQAAFNLIANTMNCDGAFFSQND